MHVSPSAAMVKPVLQMHDEPVSGNTASRHDDVSASHASARPVALLHVPAAHGTGAVDPGGQ